ncbi:LysM domain containing protein [Klebsormidium nitens]|uniref:LysM domain containing protein n=1 Tax=Klebsormidium nitens TaxID=105231 RepID=A0A1Y1IE00_KLENI|nr:LysM domain containing protein [Klebsormidium nitens]|eukprot:GAQ89150.1 LysM domain containing protein [Klebsormidium nitens]
MGLFGGNKRNDGAGDSTYTVKPGDTLSEIAQKMNVDILSLEAANVGVTRGRPNTIYPGQVLHVPRGYSSKPVLKDRTVDVPAVHVNKGHAQVHVPTLSVDRGHKDVSIPTPTVETHKKEVTVPTWSLERHDKKVEIPTVSLGKKDVHVDVPTAAIHKHDKEINMKTYSLGTHEKDVHVKVPGVETHRKEHGYGSTWDPKTPIPGTDADKAAAARHDGKKGGLFGLFGGGEDKSGAHQAHHPHAEIDRKVAVPELRGPERKGGFLGFGGKGGSRDGSGEKDFVGLKRYGNRQDIGVEFEEKKGQKVAGGLLLLAVGAGAYLAYKHVKKGDRDGKDFSTSQDKLDNIRREVKDTLNSEAKSANGDFSA